MFDDIIAKFMFHVKIAIAHPPPSTLHGPAAEGCHMNHAITESKAAVNEIKELNLCWVIIITKIIYVLSTLMVFSIQLVPKNLFLKMYSPSYCILASGFGFKPRKLRDKVNLLKHQAKYQHLRVLEIKFHMNNLVTVI